jgi:transcriptional regulator with XRE-family HTH domain
MDSFLICIEHGLTQATAAKKCGVNNSTVSVWLRRGRDADEKTDPKYVDFLIRFEAAQAEGEGLMLDRVRNAAAQDGDVRAAQWYLERLHPEKYGKQSRLEVTGADGEELIPKELFQSAVARAGAVAEKRRKKKGK